MLTSYFTVCSFSPEPLFLPGRENGNYLELQSSVWTRIQPIAFATIKTRRVGGNEGYGGGRQMCRFAPCNRQTIRCLPVRDVRPARPEVSRTWPGCVPVFKASSQEALEDRGLCLSSPMAASGPVLLSHTGPALPLEPEGPQCQPGVG